MRFCVIWLDIEGFAEYAEHFEYTTFEPARRFLSSKLIRSKSVHPNVCGFLLTHADSAFLRRYTIAAGTSKRRRTEHVETELACRDFPHLLRKNAPAKLDEPVYINPDHAEILRKMQANNSLES